MEAEGNSNKLKLSHEFLNKKIKHTTIYNDQKHSASTLSLEKKQCKVALDCEMVETGKKGQGLARVSIITEKGDVLYDKISQPVDEITDYRYPITGLTSSDLEKAIDYVTCRREVLKLLKDKILIGHSIKNDLLALNYEPQKDLIRDTSYFSKFQNQMGQPYSLKYLSKKYLGKVIQAGFHDSVEDAKATLGLYKLFEEEIERENLNKNHKYVRKQVLEDAKSLKLL